jgi:hypothetical protein
MLFVGTAQAGKTTSKGVLIGSSTTTSSGVNDPGPDATGQANLTFTPVTAGNMTFFDVVVKNAGGQTLNNVQLVVGYDSATAPENLRPVSTTVTPTFPLAFSASPISVALASFSPGTPTCSTATGPITCAVGTLNAGKSFTLQVVLTTALSSDAANIAVKAVTKVAENTNDNGANQDTFAAEGSIAVAGFSCGTSSAYLPGSDPKSLGTPCSVGDPANDLHQSFGVKFPGRLTTLTLNEDGTSTLCPTTDCFGALFVADIAGDTTSDIVTWTVNIDLVAVNRTNLNLNKLVIYHYNDAGALSPAAGIANTKQNQCKSDTQANCVVSAVIDATNVLTVSFQTAGNGSTRIR